MAVYMVEKRLYDVVVGLRVSAAGRLGARDPPARAVPESPEPGAGVVERGPPVTGRALKLVFVVWAEAVPAGCEARVARKVVDSPSAVGGGGGNADVAHRGGHAAQHRTEVGHRVAAEPRRVEVPDGEARSVIDGEGAETPAGAGADAAEGAQSPKGGEEQIGARGRAEVADPQFKRSWGQAARWLAP